LRSLPDSRAPEAPSKAARSRALSLSAAVFFGGLGAPAPGSFGKRLRFDRSRAALSESFARSARAAALGQPS
jgi:hypothetical protein